MAVRKSSIPRGELSSLQIQHDDWCAQLNGAAVCNCYPNLLLSRPSGMFEIDHKGRLVKCEKSWMTHPDIPLSGFRPHIEGN